MKTIEYKIGQVEMTFTCNDEDYEWMYLLFTRNANPLKALRDIGFMPVEKDARKDPNKT